MDEAMAMMAVDAFARTVEIIILWPWSVVAVLSISLAFIVARMERSFVKLLSIGFVSSILMLHGAVWFIFLTHPCSSSDIVIINDTTHKMPRVDVTMAHALSWRGSLEPLEVKRLLLYVNAEGSVAIEAERDDGCVMSSADEFDYVTPGMSNVLSTALFVIKDDSVTEDILRERKLLTAGSNAVWYRPMSIIGWTWAVVTCPYRKRVFERTFGTAAESNIGKDVNPDAITCNKQK